MTPSRGISSGYKVHGGKFRCIDCEANCLDAYYEKFAEHDAYVSELLLLSSYGVLMIGEAIAPPSVLKLRIWQYPLI